MDSQNPTTTSGSPNLSQYFVNDPPSFFDNLASSSSSSNNVTQTTTTTPPTAAILETAANTTMSAANSPNSSIASDVNKSTTHANSPIMASTYTGGFKPTEYIESPADLEDEQNYPEAIRNIWETAEQQTGIPPLLTMPGLSIANDLPDVIAESVAKHLGEEEVSQRKIFNTDSVTQDERGLRKLISAGCYRAAINLTGRLLTIYGQGYGRAGQPTKHSPFSLQLWFTRLALLVKIGEHEILRKEAEPFAELDRPDVFYEFYPDMYSDKTGSMACFSFRLLIAELPIYSGNLEEALDRLSKMYINCNFIKLQFEKFEMDNGITFWNKREIRVLHALINCALTLKKFNLIDVIINEKLLEMALTKEEKRALFSAWGRIYLQIGDIFGAEQKFAEARRLREINSPPDLRDLVDKGLIAVAKNDFPEAYLVFQKALHIESGNTMILNNMGVCLLYAGKLKDAIKLFERAINLNPQKSLNENLLINLSTLYELESNNSRTKKINLLRLVNKYKPDLSINLDVCLKLQSAN